MLKKKQITLEKLAQMIVKGFEGTVSKNEFENEIEKLKKEIGGIKSEMVTKTFLEDKLADLEGNVVLRQRKEDIKVNLVIELLKKKKVFNASDIKMLQEIRIFPNLER